MIEKPYICLENKQNLMPCEKLYFYSFCYA